MGSATAPLNATHRDFFRGPFRSQLQEFGHFVKFPTKRAELGQTEQAIRRCFSPRKNWRDSRRAGAGARCLQRSAKGIFAAAEKSLRPTRCAVDSRRDLHRFRAHGKMVCLRTRPTWSPDLICLGKALTGGFPLSACVGRVPDVMDAAWPPSAGEAIHTSTFLGHPVGCAMALAQIAEIQRLRLPERAAQLGEFLLNELHSQSQSTKRKPKRGAWIAGRIGTASFRRQTRNPRNHAVISTMWHYGYILLPEGAHGNVISFTPPLKISEAQLRRTVKKLAEVLK